MVLDAQASDTPVTIEGDAVAFLGAVAIVVYLAVGRVMRVLTIRTLMRVAIANAGAVATHGAHTPLHVSTSTGGHAWIEAGHLLLQGVHLVHRPIGEKCNSSINELHGFAFCLWTKRIFCKKSSLPGNFIKIRTWEK